MTSFKGVFKKCILHQQEAYAIPHTPSAWPLHVTPVPLVPCDHRKWQLGPVLSPPYPQLCIPGFSQPRRGNIGEENFQKVSKCKTEICHMLVTYLHSIYTVLIIINNIEIISTTWEDCVRYMQISHYFIQGTWACSDFGIHWESRNQPYMDTEGWLYQ